MTFRPKLRLWSEPQQIATIRCVDGTLVIAVIVVVMPLAVLWALSKSAALRGPLARPESRRPVGSLVTEVVPEKRPEEDEEEPVPQWSIDSDPPEADPERRSG